MVNSDAAALHPTEPTDWLRPRALRIFLWIALVVLLIAAQALLVTLAFHYRSTRTQQAVEAHAAMAVDELAQLLGRDLRSMLGMPGIESPSAEWRASAQQLLIARPELLRFVEEYRSRAGITTETGNQHRTPIEES